MSKMYKNSGGVTLYNMPAIDFKDVRARFLKVYANLPLKLRNEIILVIDDEPVTWNAVYLEVYNNTDKGKIMLNKMVELKLI